MLDARGVETIGPREVNLTPPLGVWHGKTPDFREIGSHNMCYQTMKPAGHSKGRAPMPQIGPRLGWEPTYVWLRPRRRGRGIRHADR